MTSLNSKLQLAVLNRKKGRNLLEKGFTLVELMIVIVIVGVLSAVALPNFLSQTSKAKATECNSLGAGIMSQVGPESLSSTTEAFVLLGSLVASADTASTYCDFTAMSDAPTTGSTFTMTAIGKGDLTGKYSGSFCVNGLTGKKDIKSTNTTSAPNPGATC